MEIHNLATWDSAHVSPSGRHKLLLKELNSPSFDFLLGWKLFDTTCLPKEFFDYFLFVGPLESVQSLIGLSFWSIWRGSTVLIHDLDSLKWWFTKLFLLKSKISLQYLLKNDVVFTVLHNSSP